MNLGGIGNSVAGTFIAATLLGLFWWLVAQIRSAQDRTRVHDWLSANTSLAPCQSYASSEDIAKGTHLPEDRVHRACMSDDRILKVQGLTNAWSVFSDKQLSVYEERGLLEY